MRPPLIKWMEDAGELKLEVRAAGTELRRLVAEGSTKLAVTVRFTPRGGIAQTATRRVDVTAAG